MTTRAPVFLMSYPRPDWGIRGGSNFLSSQSAQKTSARGAMEDWLAVACAIQDAGGEVLVMPPSSTKNLTGMPYTAEAGEFYRDKDGKPSFLLPSMKPAHRQAEPDYAAGFVAGLGWSSRQVTSTWEAQGDAIRVGNGRIVHTSGEGPSARTSQDAFEEVAPLLGGEAHALRFKADPWFHGNTFLACFSSPDQTRHHVLVCPDALLPGELEKLKTFLGDTDLTEIGHGESTNYATNALQVNKTVIAPSGQPDYIRGLWKDLGLDIVELELPQLFRKGGGAAVCMTSRLYGLSAEELPQHVRFSSLREQLIKSAQEYPG